MGDFRNIKGLKDISTIGVASIAGSGIAAIFWIYLAALMGAENYGELAFYISIASVATSISFIGGPAAITVLVAKKIIKLDKYNDAAPFAVFLYIITSCPFQ